MKGFHYLIVILFVVSCSSKKTVELPEVDHSEISEVSDLSQAYLFYNTSKTDSIELNRRNLISTTNWILHVDKRLTLAQAIPKIMFLQDKKRNAAHKNTEAKNYYTCNDRHHKTLGFIDFTEVTYHLNDFKPTLDSSCVFFRFEKPDHFNFKTAKGNTLTTLNSNISRLPEILDSLIIKRPESKIVLGFKSALHFQDYIWLKSKLSELDSRNKMISTDEFIFN